MIALGLVVFALTVMGLNKLYKKCKQDKKRKEAMKIDEKIKKNPILIIREPV